MRAKANIITKTIAVVLQGATSIPVENIVQFPDAPNYATLINRVTNDFETVVYNGIVGDSLTACVRGVEGIDREWDASTSVGRFFTAIEWNDVLDKVGVMVNGVDWQTDVVAILNTPPVAPAVDSRYIVGTLPTGLFVGHEEDIATYNAGWTFTTPQDTWGVFVYDTIKIYIFTTHEWLEFGDLGRINDILNETKSARDSILTDIGFITVSADLLGPDTIGAVANNEVNVSAVGSNIANVIAVDGNELNINAVNANKININAVNANKTNIDIVALDKANIDAVVANKVNIDAVNANKANIDIVALNKTNIDAVGINIANVIGVDNNEININAVNANKVNINAVNANKAHIDIVALNKANVDAVGSNIANVIAVDNNEININAVNANKANIDIVALDKANIDAVVANELNINAVNANKVNIDIVALNKTNIDLLAPRANDISILAPIRADITTVAGDSVEITALGARTIKIDALYAEIDQIAVKANLASPTFTGIPLAPTAISGTNTTQIATTGFVSGAVSDLISSSPATLDTLNELAAALGDDPNFATTVATNIGLKADKTITISAGSGLIGGGDLNANRIISHADTSTQVSLTALTGAVVLSDVDLDTYGHVTNLATRTLTLANLGYTGATNANYFTYTLPVATTSIGGVKSGTDISVDASGNVSVNDDSHNHIISNIDGLQGALDGKVDDSQVLTNVPSGALFTDTVYTHPTYIGDDISVDTGALTGAVVVSDVDFNITTDALGHIVDANGVIATRTLTLANLGYTGSATANDYTHPSDGGGSIGTALTGAVVISSMSVNTLGHVTATSTRTLTLANLGYTGATNANYFTYSLPVASTALGGIKAGTDITIDASGNVSVVDDSHNHIVSNIDGLQGALDGKIDDSQVLTNVPSGALFTDTVYTHPLGDGNLHVPATLTINEGKVLTAGATAGSLSWVTPPITYTLPVATTLIGGVKSGTDISVDASGNVSVVDDSHNHVTGNVDGLDTALGLKFDKSAITISASAPSGGVDGDLWYNYI